jgi:hypothetical protein
MLGIGLGEVLLIFTCLLVMAGGVLSIVLLVKNLTGLRGEVDRARADFLTAVGYPWASSLGGDPNRTRSKQTTAGVFSHTFDVRAEGRGTVTAQSWHLAARPGVSFQLIEKSLVGAGRALLNLVGPVSRTLTVKFPGPHAIGDAELDARFVLHTNEPAAAGALLRRVELKAALAELKEVCLIADEDGISFGDPSDANVYASGASRFDVSPVPSIRAAITVHQRVERLLVAVARLSEPG